MRRAREFSICIGTVAEFVPRLARRAHLGSASATVPGCCGVSGRPGFCNKVYTIAMPIGHEGIPDTVVAHDLDGVAGGSVS
jgi:hypothetical protein